MKPKPSDDRQSISLDQLAYEIYESLARRFPICLGSDEFHFFPHYRSKDHDWSEWDDFSSESVEDVITLITQWEQQLRTLSFEIGEEFSKISDLVSKSVISDKSSMLLPTKKALPEPLSRAKIEASFNTYSNSLLSN